MYRGELVEAEDSWNVQLKNVTATSKVRTHRFMLCTVPCLISTANEHVDQCCRTAEIPTWSTFLFVGAGSGMALACDA